MTLSLNAVQYIVINYTYGTETRHRLWETYTYYQDNLDLILTTSTIPTWRDLGTCFAGT